MLQIHTIPAFQDNYFWLFHEQASTDAFVVDPGDSPPVLNALHDRGLNLAGIIITHHHADHIGGVDELLQHFDVPVFGPANSSISQITVPLAQDDRVTLAGYEFSVLEVPGHTLDHIAYFADLPSTETQAPILFCGDTLFAGGCGRVFEGTTSMMYSSLSRLAALPAQTRVYCAHEYTLANLEFALAVEPDNGILQRRIERDIQKREQKQPTVPSTLELELQTNPFLRCDQASVVKAAHQQTKTDDLCEPAQVFAVIRHWKDNF